MAEPLKKGGGLTVALGLGKPSKVPSAPESEPEMDDDDFDAAASQAFDAITEGDLAGFKLAFKTAVMACKDEY